MDMYNLINGQMVLAEEKQWGEWVTAEQYTRAVNAVAHNSRRFWSSHYRRLYRKRLGLLTEAQANYIQIAEELERTKELLNIAILNTPIKDLI
jgi:hypothetical protein